MLQGPFLQRKTAIEAEENRCYPDAEVIGTDLSPIQPVWYAYTHSHDRGRDSAYACTEFY